MRTCLRARLVTTVYMRIYVCHGESFLFICVCVRRYGWYTNPKLLIYLCGDAPRVATTVTHTQVGGRFDGRKNAPPKRGEKIPRRSGVWVGLIRKLASPSAP